MKYMVQEGQSVYDMYLNKIYDSSATAGQIRYAYAWLEGFDSVWEKTYKVNNNMTSFECNAFNRGASYAKKILSEQNYDKRQNDNLDF